jgi:hypothetical protein
MKRRKTRKDKKNDAPRFIEEEEQQNLQLAFWKGLQERPKGDPTQNEMRPRPHETNATLLLPQKT